MFIDTVRLLSDDIANAYIITGELILDIALLRSIDDFVSDEMSHEAMRLINRDESRHITIDYYMCEHYASDEYFEKRQRQSARSVEEQVRAARTFTSMLYYAQPFIRDVFLRPMERLDPRGKRLREAFKRMQILGMRDAKARLPFTRFLRSLQVLFNHPVAGPLVGDFVGRVAGVGRFLERFYTDEEIERARGMTYTELAQEALAMKSAD